MEAADLHSDSSLLSPHYEERRGKPSCICCAITHGQVTATVHREGSLGSESRDSCTEPVGRKQRPFAVISLCCPDLTYELNFTPGSNAGENAVYAAHVS